MRGAVAKGGIVTSQQWEPIRAPVLIRILVAELKSWADAAGPCEHDVNICYCQTHWAIQRGEEWLDYHKRARREKGTHNGTV